MDTGPRACSVLRLGRDVHHRDFAVYASQVPRFGVPLHSDRVGRVGHVERRRGGPLACGRSERSPPDGLPHRCRAGTCGRPAAHLAVHARRGKTPEGAGMGGSHLRGLHGARVSSGMATVSDRATAGVAGAAVRTGSGLDLPRNLDLRFSRGARLLRQVSFRA